MSETTDTARLLARGAQVILRDGSQVRLVMDAEHMVIIEDEFDGLENFAEVLQRKPIRSTATALRVFCGLPDDEAALRAMDTRRMDQYVSAIGDALAEALPEQTVTVDIVQNHEIGDDQYRAGTRVEVSSERAAHLIKAHVAKPVEEPDSGNGVAALSASPGAAGTTLPSSHGGSRRRRSGA